MLFFGMLTVRDKITHKYNQANHSVQIKDVVLRSDAYIPAETGEIEVTFQYLSSWEHILIIWDYFVF